ncbi:hypothetical protein NDU88_002342 [Pleurodeles waltl]|uniref:Uncharacterized protein n=1 Tax=Pleurodeles waltl TaxID=8319 RepID=A0AAV7RBK8_PLEWA|nr:hypothetical protein NDU88_002342 [Pleurodeles waltl]
MPGEDRRSQRTWLRDTEEARLGSRSFPMQKRGPRRGPATRRRALTATSHEGRGYTKYGPCFKGSTND